MFARKWCIHLYTVVDRVALRHAINFSSMIYFACKCSLLIWKFILNTYRLAVESYLLTTYRFVAVYFFLFPLSLHCIWHGYGRFILTVHCNFFLCLAFFCTSKWIKTERELCKQKRNDHKTNINRSVCDVSTYEFSFRSKWKMKHIKKTNHILHLHNIPRYLCQKL